MSFSKKSGDDFSGFGNRRAQRRGDRDESEDDDHDRPTAPRREREKQGVSPSS